MADDRTHAVPRAMHWLNSMHGRAVREALDSRFFGVLEDDEYDQLPDQYNDAYQQIMTNALEWLLADGVITVKGKEQRVADAVLGRGGPLFSAEQRRWIELLAAAPLRLYEVVDVVAGECMTLKDILLPDRPPVLVQEKSGSQRATRFDVIGARLIPFKDQFELSGAAYLFPRNRIWDLLKDLRDELDGLEPDSCPAKEVTGVLIPHHWLMLWVTRFEVPQVVDHATGEPVLFITDHYRVQEWEALDRALAAQTDVDGSRETGWNRLLEGKDGFVRARLSIDLSKYSDRIKVSYRTQTHADEGRPWFEAIAGSTVTFISREISDSKGVFGGSPPADEEEPVPPSLPPEIATQLMEKSIRQYYANWADEPIPVLNNKTPREAVQTAEGLEQVKFLLRTYEQGEAQQAKAQSREPVSYDFLWQSVGIAP
ncbi:MAG TPA: zinc chelation protein SecC [Nitrosospira sp.]|nr:zinc chelation protein SecC [Nitrosospira sp.]